jgi:hypothetical protein
VQVEQRDRRVTMDAPDGRTARTVNARTRIAGAAESSCNNAPFCIVAGGRPPKQSLMHVEMCVCVCVCVYTVIYVSVFICIYMYSLRCGDGKHAVALAR